MVSPAIEEESVEDVDADVESLPELQAAKAARLHKSKIFFMTVSFGLITLLSYEKKKISVRMFFYLEIIKLE